MFLLLNLPTDESLHVAGENLGAGKTVAKHVIAMYASSNIIGREEETFLLQNDI